MDDFQRAHNIGLNHITQWLPSGKKEGKEWSAINPTRFDSNLGSFKVNLNTGKWLDGSSGDKGGDTVSLYAYLNQPKLRQDAIAKGYKNIQGAIQALAAREILLTYDSTYFPTDDNIIIPQKKLSEGEKHWAGYYRVLDVNDQMPGMKLEWYEKKFGKKVGQWDFFRKEKFVMRVVRFQGPYNEKKKKHDKADRPFTIWSNGSETKWRCKGPGDLYPLWNMDELTERPNAKVLLWEGQKDAAIGKGTHQDYVSVGWYQGAGNSDVTDWEPLTGREVWFCFDADAAGRKSIPKVKEIAKSLGTKLHIVYPPPDVPKGWSLADEMQNGMTIFEIDSILEEASAGQTRNEDADFIDDNPFEFKILGYSGEYITFYPFGSRKVTKHKATGLSKSALMTLMDRAKWGKFYAKDDGGIAWDSACNDLLRSAEKSPVFNPSIVRGSGAWIDDGKLVISTGEKLIIDNQKRELYEAPGRFIYERGLPMPYTTENPAELKTMKSVSSLIDKFQWKNPMYAKLFLGWLLLAPFAGALKWRPHIWITGRKGSGKSWLMTNIVLPLVGIDFGVAGFGSSTPAGIRNALGNSSKCSVMDEMESSNKKAEENIEHHLMMFREASSGNGQGMATLHGTADGEGRQWVVQTMACCASIGAAIRHGADRDRFSILKLCSKGEKVSVSEGEKIFQEILKESQFITNILGRSIVARSLLLFENIQKAIDVMTNQLIDITGSRRDADQMGTLLAGAWMFENSKQPSAASAKAYLDEINFEMIDKTLFSKSDEELCLDEILAQRVEMSDGTARSKISIGAALTFWYKKITKASDLDIDHYPGVDLKSIKRELEQVGIKAVNLHGPIRIQIAVSHPIITKMLRDTPWSLIYPEILLRLKFASSKKKGTTLFAGMSKQYIELKAADIFEDQEMPLF